FQRAKTDTGKAQNHMPQGPARPPVPMTKPGVDPPRQLKVPGDEVATIVAPKGETIQSVVNVGDVRGDQTDDFAVVTDKAAYVVSGGNSSATLRLASLTPGDDRGVRLADVTEVIPAGDFDGSAPGDLVVVKNDGSVYVVTDLSQPVDAGTQLTSDSVAVGMAGDFDGDRNADVAVADSSGTVTVYFGPDATRTQEITGARAESFASIPDL